jgi:hypothetical protein
MGKSRRAESEQNRKSSQRGLTLNAETVMAVHPSEAIDRELLVALACVERGFELQPGHRNGTCIRDFRGFSRG